MNDREVIAELAVEKEQLEMKLAAAERENERLRQKVKGLERDLQLAKLSRRTHERREVGEY
jgi:chaperonin cofactor prefoldin